ncbi:MAG: O-antigen ligase family protein [Clostridia bacterium]|nr:O-antigen ligase family protein [Clostridia bacterium]
MEHIFKSESSLRRINKVRDFLFSDQWIAILFVVAAIFACLDSFYARGSDTNHQFAIAGTVVLAYFTGFCFLFTGDILAMLIPLMFTYLVAIRCYNSLNDFLSIIWLAIPLIGIIIFNLVVYRKKLSAKGSQFKPMMFVSFAVMMGGFGFISAKEYFAGSSIYHMLGMGFGMVIVYCYLYAKIDVTKKYSLIKQLTRIMVIVGVFATFMVIAHYLININLAIDKGGIFFIRWRNNISTILMITMPFTFLLGNKKPTAIVLGFLFFLAMLLSGSRGGMVFGAIELVMCIVMFVLYDKRRRLAYVIICVCVVFGLLIFLPQITKFLNNTFVRLFNVLNDFLIGGEDTETRVRHYARGVEDFLNHPILGTGLGYMGNRDIFKNKAGALCWYHCEPIQIAASFGILGIVAFVYQFIKRNMLIWKKATLFNMTVFLSYISLEMMSLVNPGILCPVPYLLLITLFLVIVEKCDDGETQEKIPVFKKVSALFKSKKATKKAK